MQMNSRIKIKIEDNTCIIQPDSIIKDTITNSMSLNISKSNNEDNGEITMQSIFHSDKRSLASSLHRNDTPLNESKSIQSFKPDNNNPTIKQLSILSKHTKTCCSAISLNKKISEISMKNTIAVLSTKGNTLSSFKTASISNIATSPFKSNANYSHSNSLSFNEWKSPSALRINNKMVATFKKKNNPTLALNNQKNCIDGIIGKKIIKQRSLSSRNSRPSSILIHSTLPNYNRRLKKNVSRTMTMTMISLPRTGMKRKMTPRKHGNNNFWSSVSTASLLDSSKQQNRIQKHIPFSLLKFIGDCITKSVILKQHKTAGKRLGKCFTCRSCNDIADNFQLKKQKGNEIASNPKYSKYPKKEDISHNERIGNAFRVNTCIEGNMLKKFETISNFSHYAKKGNNKIQVGKGHSNGSNSNYHSVNKQKLMSKMKMNHPNIIFNSEPFMLHHKRVIVQHN